MDCALAQILEKKFGYLEKRISYLERKSMGQQDLIQNLRTKLKKIKKLSKNKGKLRCQRTPIILQSKLNEEIESTQNHSDSDVVEIYEESQEILNSVEKWIDAQNVPTTFTNTTTTDTCNTDMSQMQNKMADNQLEEVVKIEGVSLKPEESVRKNSQICSFCSKSFENVSELSNHMRMHPGERTFRCKICSISFSLMSSFINHSRIHTAHCSEEGQEILNSDEILFEKVHDTTACTDTSIVSQNKIPNNLLEVKIEGISLNPEVLVVKKSHICSFCSKSFTNFSKLSDHMRVHTGERPFKCKICSKSFTQIGNLKRHSVVHTGDKPNSCSVCSKSFLHLSKLSEHMRVHTGERPFKCKICSKSFSQIGNLKRHSAEHTDEKPFSCPVCSKTFTNSSYLSNHKKIHTGVKPYSCSICGKLFFTPGELKRHEKSFT